MFSQKCKCESGDMPISSLLISNSDSTTQNQKFNFHNFIRYFWFCCALCSALDLHSLMPMNLSVMMIYFDFQPPNNEHSFKKNDNSKTKYYTILEMIYISGWCSETIHKFTIQIRSETSSYSEACMELLNLKVLQILWFITRISV